jgi:hypothetical protein
MATALSFSVEGLIHPRFNAEVFKLLAWVGWLCHLRLSHCRRLFDSGSELDTVQTLHLMPSTPLTMRRASRTEPAPTKSKKRKRGKGFNVSAEHPPSSLSNAGCVTILTRRKPAPFEGEREHRWIVIAEESRSV